MTDIYATFDENNQLAFTPRGPRLYQTERLGAISYADQQRRVAELESQGWNVYGIVEIFGHTTLRMARWAKE